MTRQDTIVIEESPMKDAFERRALLLHLGRTLQLLARLLETQPTALTIGEFIALNPMLEDEPLLVHALPSLPLDVFVAQALHAFAGWPQRLLDATLDHDAFAIPIRDTLFERNATGWDLYAAGLRQEVGWFGREQAARRRAPPRRRGEAGAPAQAGAEAIEMLISPEPPHDIERDESSAQRISESIEGLAPPNGAARANEESLPEPE